MCAPIAIAGPARGLAEPRPRVLRAKGPRGADRRVAATLSLGLLLGAPLARAEPGPEAEGAPPPLLPSVTPEPERPGPFRVGVKLGPSFGLRDLPTQLALQVELAVAVTPDRLGSVVLPVQLLVVGEPSALLVPLGFQYDFPLPLPGLYLSPRLGLGYAALLDGNGTISHLGVAVAELGLRYAPLRRLSFGLDPLSVPVLFDAGRALVSYRVLGYAGVTF